MWIADVGPKQGMAELLVAGGLSRSKRPYPVPPKRAVLAL
jgi:hypothetical protein